MGSLNKIRNWISPNRSALFSIPYIPTIAGEIATFAQLPRFSWNVPVSVLVNRMSVLLLTIGSHSQYGSNDISMHSNASGLSTCKSKNTNLSLTSLVADESLHEYALGVAV